MCRENDIARNQRNILYTAFQAVCPKQTEETQYSQKVKGEENNKENQPNI